MTTIKINNEEFELKFGFKAHKELQSIIKQSGLEATEFLTEENYPTLIKVALKSSKPDATIEEIEEAIEDLNYPQLMELVNPYLKYYSPNVVSPTASK
jgi:4-hydroxy-3-methylbut-2-en-1-yl diphosphate synthase IspG/GcpE